MEEDPLESIPIECKITFSQDEKLKKCGDENEGENSIQVSGIVIVSPPESNEESVEGDVFHTPPEQQQSQSMSGSEDQGPDIPGQAQALLMGNEVGGFTQAESAAELGKDSVALGFSELNELDAGNCVMDSDALVLFEPDVVDSVKGVLCEPDLGKSITMRTVYLGKDSDTLVMNDIKRIDGVKDVVSDRDLSKSITDRTVDLGKDSEALLFPEMNVIKRIDDVKNVASDGDLSNSRMERIVDLGKGSNTLVVSEMNDIKRIDDVKDVASDCDLSKSGTERTVDLGKDSDTLLFSEVNVIKKIDGVKDVASDSDLIKDERDSKGCKVLESECGQSVVNECNVSAEDMEYTEPIVIESENVEIEETEVVNMEVEESCEEMGVSESTKNVEGEDSGGHSTGQNVEEYAAGGYVNGRELINLFIEPGRNEGLSVLQQALNDVNTIMDILEAAENSFGEGTPDTDFMRAAARRGLIFYRPRWYPPEGFDDQVTDNI